MKVLRYLFIVILLLVLHAALSAQDVSPQFSELKGIEDAQGNTHLLYRIFSFESDPSYTSLRDDIYNLIPGTSIDTIFLNDHYFCNSNYGSGDVVNTYNFWDQDLSKYIYAGIHINCLEPDTFFISRFDSLVYNDGWNFIRTIIISEQNDSLVFGLPNLISYDRGFNWDTLQLAHSLVSVSPFNDSAYFSNDFTISLSSVLFKSTDRGNTFTLVDTGGSNWDFDFYYDFDGKHIYREYTTDYPNRSIRLSVDQGNPFTWQTIYTTNNNLFVSLDQLVSGEIYLADGKKILKSTDYGTTFTLYRELEKAIIGIYKKPRSNKLYAATKYRIYEITDDTITIIKSLPIPEELLAFYPLAIGSKWIYDYTWVDWITPHDPDIFVREVRSEELRPNGKKYFKILEKYVQMGFESTVYERIDSVEGRVYRYDENCPNNEQFIEDLVMEVGDTTYAASFGYCIEHAGTELSSEQTFNRWGIEGSRRNYNYVELITADYFLASDIGLDYFKLSDDNGDKTFTLKGMLKNGIVYGDTTLTDVADENELPKEFSLSQNYPNPFNPSTIIKYALGGRQLVTLKVFDLLGREVTMLVNEEKPAGNYEVEFSINGRLASGIYFYRLQAGSYVETKKMIYLK